MGAKLAVGELDNVGASVLTDGALLWVGDADGPLLRVGCELIVPDILGACETVGGLETVDGV